MIRDRQGLPLRLEAAMTSRVSMPALMSFRRATRRWTGVACSARPTLAAAFAELLQQAVRRSASCQRAARRSLPLPSCRLRGECALLDGARRHRPRGSPPASWNRLPKHLSGSEQSKQTRVPLRAAPGRREPRLALVRGRLREHVEAARGPPIHRLRSREACQRLHSDVDARASGGATRARRLIGARRTGTRAPSPLPLDGALADAESLGQLNGEPGEVPQFHRDTPRSGSRRASLESVGTALQDLGMVADDDACTWSSGSIAAPPPRRSALSSSAKSTTTRNAWRGPRRRGTAGDPSPRGCRSPPSAP